jgi:hypothetical protein
MFFYVSAYIICFFSVDRYFASRVICTSCTTALPQTNIRSCFLSNTQDIKHRRSDTNSAFLGFGRAAAALQPHNLAMLPVAIPPAVGTTAAHPSLLTLL